MNQVADQAVIKYQSVVYMQKLRATNTGKDYYMLGDVVDGHPNTLAVTQVGGNGGTMFFCQLHNFVYHFQDTCKECREQVREVDTAGV